MAVDEEVCIVTQPVSPASSAHIDDLVTIIGSITGVSLIAANLPDNHRLRDEIDVVDIASVGTGSAIPVAAWRFLRNQVRMSRHIRRRPESVIWFFGATSYLLPILVAKVSKKTVVVQPRGDVPQTLRLHWERRVPTVLARILASTLALIEYVCYRLADGIVTYTPSMAMELNLDRFEQKLHTDGARFVDTNQFRPIVPYEERGNVIGFVGRLDEEKGIRPLAAVAQQLPDECTFRFIGDGALKDWLKNELSAEIEAGSIELTGWISHDDLPAELNEMRLLVLPTTTATEGLPTVMLEAMACGTPVYGSPVSGVPDLVTHGSNGFLVDSDDPNAIAEELRGILNDDDLDAMSSNARTTIEREYTLEEAVGRYSQILEQL